jgi:putative oxidoreductase
MGGMAVPLIVLPRRHSPTGPEIIRATVRFVLAVVFLFAAVPKLMDPAGFVTAIEGFRLVPRSVAWVAAFWVPWLEIVAAIGLLLIPTERAARLLYGSLLVFFLVILASAAARGLDVDCGCFGAGPEGTTSSIPGTMLRNIVLLIALVLSARRPPPLTTHPGTPPLAAAPGS